MQFSQVFDRRVKSKYFIGNFDQDLLPTLPWITDLTVALGATDAREDFVETINLRKLGMVLQGIQVRVGVLCCFILQGMIVAVCVAYWGVK